MGFRYDVLHAGKYPKLIPTNAAKRIKTDYKGVEI